MPTVPIKAFLSYSIRDSDLAGELRSSLDQLGIETFLAHRSIAASKEWRSEIKRQLAKRKVFIVLLTRNSRRSDWVNQEVGMAISLKKTIIPVSAPTVPYGFVADFQAVKINPSDVGADTWRIVDGIFARHHHSRKNLRKRALKLLCESRGFHQTRDMLRILTRVFSPLSLAERRAIYEASKTNSQVAGFREVLEYLTELEREFDPVR
jgi:hypothetical protein